MKKLSKILSAVLVLMLLFSLIAYANSEVDEKLSVNTFPTTEEVDKIIEEQRPAQEAYEQILDAFFTTKNGDIIYPDNFGGAYYKDGYLYVNIVGSSENVKSSYMNTVNDDVVKTQTVSYSYNELEKLMMSIAPLKIDGVTGLEIDVYTNTVGVSIDSDKNFDEVKMDILSNLQKEYGNDEIPVSFTIAEKSYPQTIWGGDQIESPTSYATAGICGTWQGSPAILTAGHAVDVGASYSHVPSGNTMGTGLYRQYRSDELYDHGVISVTSSNLTLTNRVHNNSNYTSITSTLRSGSGLVGTVICKYGYRTGFSLAEIKSTNTVAYYGNIAIYGLMRGEITSGNSRSGDSGGPYYLGHVLYGVHSGGHENAGVGSNVYFSPIYAVPSSFVVKTN